MLSELRARCITPEEAARQQRAGREKDLRRNMVNACIPARYRTADLRTCPVEVAHWFDGIKAGAKRNLVLQGEAGAGKTYAACAALAQFIRDTGQQGIFVTFDELLADIKDAYKAHESERFTIFRYTGKPLLVIDDFGKEYATQWALPVIWRIINKRYNDQLPTIFTTQYNSEQLGTKLCARGGDTETAKAIIRRMVDPLVDGCDSSAMVVKVANPVG